MCNESDRKETCSRDGEHSHLTYANLRATEVDNKNEPPRLRDEFAKKRDGWAIKTVCTTHRVLAAGDLSEGRQDPRHPKTLTPGGSATGGHTGVVPFLVQTLEKLRRP